jgi:AraC-like DNA-binding protein
MNPDRAEFRRPAHRGGVELYRARIVRHVFEPHTHQAFGLGAIEQGVERFRYRGGEHLAPADSLVLMNPDELHTGRAETEGGWCYRMVYLDADVVEALSGERGWSFAAAVAEDRAAARRVGTLLQGLWDVAGDPLAFDSGLLRLIDALRPHARVGHAAAREGRPRFDAVFELMHARLAARLTLDDLAAAVGLSPFHFLRAFKVAHGATPREALMALRLFDAKRRLAAGEVPADVAAASGLADQAHLTHAFMRRYGVTPGRYRAQVAGMRTLA